jgi:hypothetical protein
MGDTNNSNRKPAQVLLGEKDRQMIEVISQRVGGRRRISGPTALFRAGLVALSELADERLLETFDQLDERPTLAQLQETFDQWCADVGRLVAQRNIALQYAWEGARHSDQRGYFTDQGRFVLMSTTGDGRVMISGMAAVPEPVSQHGRIPRATVLFPGGLATLLSMNAAGMELAVRAIIAWLTGDDEKINAVRLEIREHHAEVLR